MGIIELDEATARAVNSGMSDDAAADIAAKLWAERIGHNDYHGRGRAEQFGAYPFVRLGPTECKKLIMLVKAGARTVGQLFGDDPIPGLVIGTKGKSKLGKV